MEERIPNNRNLEDKARVVLSDRQIRYLSARAAGKTRKEACSLAGYSPNVKPSHIEGKQGMKRAILNAMEVNGITDELLGRKLKEGLEAEKSTLVTFKGQVMNEVKSPDYENRHKYVKTALEIRGDLLPENQNTVNIGLIELPKVARSADEWNSQMNEPNSQNA